MNKKEVKDKLQEFIDFKGDILFCNNPNQLRLELSKVLYLEGAEYIVSPQTIIDWNYINTKELHKMVDKIRKKEYQLATSAQRIAVAMAAPIRAEFKTLGESFELAMDSVYAKDSKIYDWNTLGIYETRLRLNRFASFDVWNEAKDLLVENFKKEIFKGEDPKEFFIVYKTTPTVAIMVEDTIATVVVYMVADVVKKKLGEILKVVKKNNVYELQSSLELRKRNNL